MSDRGETRQETMVRFERRMPGPLERAWEFITSSEHLGKWLMAGSIEPREGGAVNLGDGHIRGVVTQWQPPRRLTYTWNVFSPGEMVSGFPESYVTFELEPIGDSVQLVLTHRPILLKEFEGRTMMGWHTLLDSLVAVAQGRQPEARDVAMERNRVLYGVEKFTPTS
jgi:uncharacterized protein YndB with AHSA1/START domain